MIPAAVGIISKDFEQRQPGWDFEKGQIVLILANSDLGYECRWESTLGTVPHNMLDIVNDPILATAAITRENCDVTFRMAWVRYQTQAEQTTTFPQYTWSDAPLL